MFDVSAMDDDRRAVIPAVGPMASLQKPCREDELLRSMWALLNIAYDYEELSENDQLAADFVVSNREPAATAAELIVDIRNATLSGNKSLTWRSSRCPKTEMLNLRALQALLNKYDYDALTRSAGGSVPPMMPPPILHACN